MLSAFRSEWIKIRRRSILLGGLLMPLLTLLFVPLGIRSAVNGGRFGGGGLTTLVLDGDQGLTTLLARGATLTAVIALAIVASAIRRPAQEGRAVSQSGAGSGDVAAARHREHMHRSKLRRDSVGLDV